MDIPRTFGKHERICGKTSVSTLIDNGRWGVFGHFKYCFRLPGAAENSRIIASVPKKCFKRAVKRNLIKRRIREAYRTQKNLLEEAVADIMFVWNSEKLADSVTIRAEVAGILTKISSMKK